MSNVSDKKLSKWLSKWLNECSYSHDCHDCVEGNECAKAFLRVKSLIESSAQAKEEPNKPKVSREFWVDWAIRWKRIDSYYEVAVIQMLKEAGVEVEE